MLLALTWSLSKIFVRSEDDLKQLSLRNIYEWSWWVRQQQVSARFISNSRTRYVPSEGAAGLILKTKSAAIRDGDNILAIVRSTDVKHDGRSQGLVAPNVKAQIAMQIALLEKANLAPAEIEYVAFYFHKRTELNFICL